MFCERSKVDFFPLLITVHSVSLFLFIAAFSSFFPDGFIKALTPTLGLQTGSTQVAILTEISQTVQTYTETMSPIAHLIWTSSS